MSRRRGLYSICSNAFHLSPKQQTQRSGDFFKMKDEVTSVKRGLGVTKNRSDQMWQKMNGFDEIVIEITKREENNF